MLIGPVIVRSVATPDIVCPCVAPVPWNLSDASICAAVKPTGSNFVITASFVNLKARVRPCTLIGSKVVSKLMVILSFGLNMIGELDAVNAHVREYLPRGIFVRSIANGVKVWPDCTV